MELAELFRVAGHDAVTVLDQILGGVKDPGLASECLRGGAIVTLDMDFCDIRTYPPIQIPWNCSIGPFVY